MEKLSGIDRAYVGLESDDVPADFLSIITLDPSTAPDRHDFARFRAEAAARVVEIPALLRRLVTAPLAAAPEQWVVDPDFDVDRHLHRVACPAPGDLAALQRLALEVASGTLERDRPLWAMWYVEGLADGGAAVLFKIHHAAIDGMGAMAAFATLFDPEPRPTPDDLEPAPVEGERVPSGPEMLIRTLPDQVGAPLAAAQGVLELAGAQVRTLASALLGDGPPPDRPAHTADRADGTGERPAAPRHDWIPAPTTVLNRAPGSFERSLALTTVPLDDVKAIAHGAGATVNDVVLAVVAGALRGYLHGRGELPAELPLRAVCPVNVRTDDDEGGGNAFTAMFVPLPTHLDDAHARLRYVAEATAARKPGGGDGTGPSPARTVLGLVDALPSTVFSVMGGLASGGALTATPPLANLVVSNVRGPDAPLYLAGARITHLHGRTMAGPGIGMMIHCTSYAGQLDFGVTALRDLVADPEGIADRFAGEVAALRG